MRHLTIALLLLLASSASAQDRAPIPNLIKPPAPAIELQVDAEALRAEIVKSKYAVWDGFVRTGESTAKLSVEKIRDGSFIVYWPIGMKGEDECLVAFMRIPAVDKVLTDVMRDILHNGGKRYTPPLPLEYMEAEQCK